MMYRYVGSQIIIESVETTKQIKQPQVYPKHNHLKIV